MNRKLNSPNQGPWTHRFMVCFFSLLFGLLVYWLLGFVVRDIGTWPGPNYEEVQRQMLDAPLLEELESLRLQIEEKGLNSSTEEQQALAESQKLFLANQSRYQQINEPIATLSEAAMKGIHE